jgi:large repetitive protein
MPTYSASGQFTATGGANAYRLEISATTSAVAGGTLVEIFGQVVKFRTHGSVNTVNTGTRAWSLPGGRTTSTSGASSVSGTSSWPYNFPAAQTNTVEVYSFSRYVAYSHGSSTTLSITASGLGSGFLTSRTVSVAVPLFAQPIPAPVWNTTSLNDFGRVGSFYSTSVSASNTNSYSLASGSLPPGLTLSSGGTISGTMSAGVSQTFNFTITATGNGGPTPSNTFSITRFQALPVWSDNSLVTNTLRVGDSYSDGVLANNATSYSASGLPANGISLNTSNGIVSGTPTSTSSFSFTIFASNDDGNSVSADFTFSPKARLATWVDNSISTPTIKKGQSYSDGVSANNASSYALQSGTLPPGIVLAPSTGIISGTPTTVGTYNFTLSATNASSESIFTGTLTITVQPGGSGSVWNGSTWVQAAFKVWNGSTWTDAPVKVWNGSIWADPVG